MHLGILIDSTKDVSYLSMMRFVKVGEGGFVLPGQGEDEDERREKSSANFGLCKVKDDAGQQR